MMCLLLFHSFGNGFYGSISGFNLAYRFSSSHQKSIYFIEHLEACLSRFDSFNENLKYSIVCLTGLIVAFECFFIYFYYINCLLGHQGLEFSFSPDFHQD